MYGVFTYIWLIYGANVGKCSIHGAYGRHGDMVVKGPLTVWDSLANILQSLGPFVDHSEPFLNFPTDPVII